MSKRCCANNCFNSQLINKNVSYFGFPKHEEYSRQWATAAGRSDLLNKSINNIIKYFLCSEHFTDDCFVDPPNNTMLRKKTRPLIEVPIPSIFKNNFKDVVKINLEEKPPSPQVNSYESLEPETLIDTPNYMQEDLIDILDPLIGEPLQESNENTSDEPSTNLHQEEGNIVNLENTNSITSNNDDCPTSDLSTTSLDADNLLQFRTIDILYQCRLCADLFEADKQMISISTITNYNSKTIIECINRLLPESEKRSNLSDFICVDCFEKLKTCFDIINCFEDAQNRMQP